jgi:Mg2+ and Co2+ transporter CorA
MFKKILLLNFLLLMIFKAYAEDRIQYSEILNNPTDLELNLQFVKQQEELGNFKAVISTLERLSDIYSDNLDLKLYLLSISLKIDSKERTKDIIDQIKRSPALTNAIRQRLDEIIKTLDQQENQKNNEWVQFVDIGFNSTLDNNVNTMSDSWYLYI